MNLDSIKPGTPEYEALSPQQKGAITRRLKEQQMAEEAKQSNKAKPEGSGETVTLTMEDLQQMMRNVANEVRAEMQAQAPQAQQSRRMTNKDFGGAGSALTKQTQESVAQLAMSVGPVTRGGGFVPAVPEHVQARDLDEQRALINKLQGYGYRVTLDRVDFGVVFEPTDDDGVVVQGVEEPEEAQDLVKALLNADARNSRIWLQSWFNDKVLTGERQIDEAAAAEGSKAAVISNLEAGNFAGIDNFAELSAV